MIKHFKQVTFLVILIGLVLTSCKKEYKLFVGGFTAKEGEKGMSVYSFNSINGSLKLISETDVGPSPSYFCYSGKNSMFYILNEVMEFKGQFGGGLSPVKIASHTGKVVNAIIPPRNP